LAAGEDSATSAFDAWICLLKQDGEHPAARSEFGQTCELSSPPILENYARAILQGIAMSLLT